MLINKSYLFTFLHIINLEYYNQSFIYNFNLSVISGIGLAPASPALDRMTKAVWGVKYTDLFSNSKQIALYDALLKNPDSIDTLRQDPQLSKFYPKARYIAIPMLEKDLKEAYIHSANHPYVVKEGIFEAAKKAVIGPAIIETIYLNSEMRNDDILKEIVKKFECFSSEQEVLDYLDISDIGVSAHRVYGWFFTSTELMSYLGEGFADVYGVNTFRPKKF